MLQIHSWTANPTCINMRFDDSGQWGRGLSWRLSLLNPCDLPKVKMSTELQRLDRPSPAHTGLRYTGRREASAQVQTVSVVGTVISPMGVVDR